MTNAELDKLLKSAPTPERDAEYWDDFPGRVTRQLNPVRSPGFSRLGPHPTRRWAWGLGLAAACAVAGFLLGSWRTRVAAEERQWAAMQTYFREISAMFPNQLQAIVIDERGPRLVLSEQPDVPTSEPLFVRICRAQGCQSFITFSGQQIQVNGERYEVLSDARGHVLLVGQKLVWSSAEPSAGRLPYRIQARSGEMAL
jgi:hypothetical protein